MNTAPSNRGEDIEILNQRLAEHFGSDLAGLPIYRIVWSEDQFEKRFGTYNDFTESGIFIRTVTETREAPKYRQWIQEKWVLEKLCIVPEINAQELHTKISYEPLHVFMDKAGFPLPAKWEAAKYIIDMLNAVSGQESMRAKYIDPLVNETEEVRNARMKELQEALFGNESPVGDALANKESTIIMPKDIRGN